jgi:FkbM family methyltransferase
MEKIIMEHTFFDELFNDEIIVIDLGACKGEFISELSKQYKIKKAVLVEANPNNFKLLGNDENYILYNNIINNKNDDTQIFYEDINSPYNGSNVFNYFNGIRHEIKTITLDEILIQNNIDYVDILKIDIEGSEYDVLPSISNEIYDKIRQITVEFHDFIDDELKLKTESIITKLKSFGFLVKSKPIVYMKNSQNYDVIFYKP